METSRVESLKKMEQTTQIIMKDSPNRFDTKQNQILLPELPKVPASRRPTTQCVDYFRYRFDLLDLHTTRKKAVEDIKKRPIIEEYNIQIRYVII